MFFKKAVLIIHGFTGGTVDNELLAAYLEYNSNLDVYAFTLPGHDKPYIKGAKYNDWIISTEEKVEYLIKKYKKIYIVGHSMGGVIATHIASKYKQVKKLILVAPAFDYKSFDQNKKDILNLKNIIKNTDNFSAYEVILSKLLLVPIPTIAQFVKLVKKYKEKIKEINIKTLILHGEIDEVVPLKSSYYAYDNVKTNKKYLTIIKNVRHAVFKSNRSDEISNYILKFIKGGIKWKITYKSKI